MSMMAGAPGALEPDQRAANAMSVNQNSVAAKTMATRPETGLGTGVVRIVLISRSFFTVPPIACTPDSNITDRAGLPWGLLMNPEGYFYRELRSLSALSRRFL